jgi:hypothetical protein
MGEHSTRRRTLEVDDRAVALYQAGFGLAAVGAFIGLSAATVMMILRERGIPRRSRGRRWRPREEKNEGAEKKSLPIAG